MAAGGGTPKGQRLVSEDKPSAPDMERIEADFRAGVLSLREIAALHPGTNHVKIKRWADKFGWTRDLKAKINARADELVTRQAVTPPVTPEQGAKAKITERQIIEANAERIAQVRGEHRANSDRVRQLALTLLRELEGQTANIEDLERLGELLRREDDKGRDQLNDLYQKIISTPSRIDSAKKVAETLKHAITMEREAYGLDATGKGAAGGADPSESTRPLSDAERASRLASILARAKQRADVGAEGGDAS